MPPLRTSTWYSSLLTLTLTFTELTPTLTLVLTLTQVLLAHCLVLRGPLAAGSTLHRGSAVTLLAASGEVPMEGAALPDELPEGEGDEGDPRSVEMSELTSHGCVYLYRNRRDSTLPHLS